MGLPGLATCPPPQLCISYFCMLCSIPARSPPALMQDSWAHRQVKLFNASGTFAYEASSFAWKSVFLPARPHPQVCLVNTCLPFSDQLKAPSSSSCLFSPCHPVSPSPSPPLPGRITLLLGLFHTANTCFLALVTFYFPICFPPF